MCVDQPWDDDFTLTVNMSCTNRCFTRVLPFADCCYSVMIHADVSLADNFAPLVDSDDRRVGEYRAALRDWMSCRHFQDGQFRMHKIIRIIDEFSGFLLRLI